jgi:hypothetical protein
LCDAGDDIASGIDIDDCESENGFVAASQVKIKQMDKQVELLYEKHVSH